MPKHHTMVVDQTRQADAGSLGDLIDVTRQVRRKYNVFLRRMTIRKAWNLLLRLTAFVFRSASLPGLPVHVKIDVAPLCQLRCPVCPHGNRQAVPVARPPGLMSFDLFQKTIDALSGRTLAAALYNIGEPLLHPKIMDMIEYAEKRGVNTYLTTNLSLRMDDARLTRLVSSGLGMLIVAIDGVSADTFGRQRIRGDWELVRNNMVRLAQLRSSLGARNLRLVVQFLTFDFNAHERASAIQFAEEIGFDEIHFIHGHTDSWATQMTPRRSWKPKSRRPVPHCAWPYFSMVIHSTGQTSGCCNYRIEDPYLRPQEARSMGSVATASVSAIYRSATFKSARKLSANPLATGNIPGHFCEDCPVLSD